MRVGFLTILAVAQLAVVSAAADAPALRVHPERVTLRRPESSSQVLVFGKSPESGNFDATRLVTFRIDDPSIAEVLPGGRVLPRADGETIAHAELDGQSVPFPVLVTGQANPPPVSFRGDVLPVLTKAGCNSGGCHGKAEGQNGFKLSVFAFDAKFDFAAIVQEARGRRIRTTAATQSLFLRKATGETPHGGGRRIEPGGDWYRLIKRWIEEGAALDEATPESAVRLRVEPAEIPVDSQTTQQLRVTLVAADGSETCVTTGADYQSNAEAIAAVDETGLVTSTEIPGEAAILVRYMGHVGVSRLTHARPESDFTRPPQNNFIDRLVWDKLEKLGIAASPPASEAVFLRRVYLDTTGTLPTPEEVQQYLEDRAPDKRSGLVAGLLDRSEYADYWAQKWADLLRVDRNVITSQGAVAMTRWLREQIETNRPYDEFARDIVMADGRSMDENPAAFYVAHQDAEAASRAVSQLFLGVRIECAECHHHPFEKWGQADYYALAGFFTGVERRDSPLGGKKIVGGPGQDLLHPRTGETVAAAALDAPPVEFEPLADRRTAFADWMTASDNPFFARTIANRIWAHYLGRGLFEPVDDLRATNPASNEPLLDALAAYLVEVDYDVKQLTQTILESRVYQLSSATTESNRLDDQNYSRAAWKPLPAEVLLDAITAATGVSHDFDGMPAGLRAIELWDSRLPANFFQVFGRPVRQSVCACERGVEPSMAQALHLMNSEETSAKIRDRRGRAAELAASSLSNEQIVDQLYLAALSRFPSDDERRLMTSVFTQLESSGTADPRRTATEDVLWTLLNTKEFAFNH